MSDVRRVTEAFSVAPQMQPEEMVEVAAEGFTLVVNNRPDDEAPGQPSDAEMATAAQAAGLTYVFVPVTGMASEAQLKAMFAAVEGASGPVLAFCRSGTRSVTTWAQGQQALGGRDRGELVQLARAAGYDLSTVLR